jgi:hypothetical protein
MFDSARHDTEFAFTESDGAITKLDRHGASPNEKHLIFVIMVVPGEDTTKLDELDFLTIKRCDNLWTPMIRDQRKFVRQ